MAKHQYTSENQPENRRPRGRSKRTLILSAIRENALLNVSAGATDEEVEQAVFGHMADCAFSPADEFQQNQSSTCLNLLMKKGWPDVKPQSEPIRFNLTADTPSGQAIEIMQAVADGVIPSDQGTALIQALSQVMKIKEVDELEQRIKALESMSNAGKEA